MKRVREWEENERGTRRRVTTEGTRTSDVAQERRRRRYEGYVVPEDIRKSSVRVFREISKLVYPVSHEVSNVIANNRAK